ncbi:MAG: citramalate synthase [Lentisphaerae bacterium GWF2_49_21]|nr:MAG: citramalate synthase [Lentisphaerae bacterium GWF2_49_21]
MTNKDYRFKVSIYDTTLRDGTQAEGVSFSVYDKIRIAERLDILGVSYIEGGWPGSNPKDMAFFEEVKGKKLKNAKIAAFGSTRRASVNVEDDDNIRKLLEANTPVVTIFGKSWLLHVNEVLKIKPDLNIQIVSDSCAYIKGHHKEVIFDAEHFFDGYKDNSKYALDVLLAACKNGASSIVLCDTNGGTIPSEISEICRKVKSVIPEHITLGIHCHNDGDMAVANSIVAVESGARHVQGTINGFGERCGNANICSIIPALELKMGVSAIEKTQLKHLREISHFVDDLANLNPNKRLPYVGESAFAHKGGMHVNAVSKNPATFEHVHPESIGNKRRVLVSDLSGRSNIMMKIAEHNINVDEKGNEVKEILQTLKRMENEGYEFEAADASFHLLAKKVLKSYTPFFKLNGFRVIVEKRGKDEPCFSEATVKLEVLGQQELTAAEGDGPINALDLALRKALLRFFPEIGDVHLKDFKVRILDSKDGTAAKTRVLIESGDSNETWGTVGVSENMIEASWEALVDSVEYILLKKGKQIRHKKPDKS